MKKYTITYLLQPLAFIAAMAVLAFTLMILFGTLLLYQLFTPKPRN